MARTIRKNDPKLIGSIRRNRALEAAGMWSWTIRAADKILRGQDGAIRYDKCQTADLDNEGGVKLDRSSVIYSKGRSAEPKRKLRRAGKILAARQLEA